MLGPIPLNFDFKIVDEIIDELTSFGRKYKERVIYLGTFLAYCRQQVLKQFQNASGDSEAV
jgi:hypothetical protein